MISTFFHGLSITKDTTYWTFRNASRKMKRDVNSIDIDLVKIVFLCFMYSAIREILQSLELENFRQDIFSLLVRLVSPFYLFENKNYWQQVV